MCDIRDIEATSSNGSSNQDRGTPCPESMKCRFALALGAVTMNGSSG
jgi:hypothetical protein